MIESLKKLDKKFLIIAGCIIFLPIFIIILLAILRAFGNRKITHESYEEKMISAAEKYITDKEKIPVNESQVVTIKLEKMVEEGYIKSTEKYLDDQTCSGEVKVRRNGASVETNNGGFLNYTVTLKCDDYQTIHLVDKLKEQIVTQESGLYKVGEDYIFKGDQVKNYINLYGFSYRIMSIDKNNILKLIKTEPEGTSRLWDNKYNSEIKHSYGKNIYKDSLILKFLINDYENVKKINKKTKQKIVAYDVCIGKRNTNDKSISKEVDCSVVLENQLISLMNASDFAMASTDVDCTSTDSRSCRNYNYLYDVAYSSWTLNSVVENTYEAFYISDGILQHQNCNLYNEYNMVIHIDGEELYTEGKGTSAEPYIID